MTLPTHRRFQALRRRLRVVDYGRTMSPSLARFHLAQLFDVVPRRIAPRLLTEAEWTATEAAYIEWRATTAAMLDAREIQ